MQKIFIVEDDRTIASAVKAALESWGYASSAAADFRQVTEELIAYDPQLVLMDVSLPFYNGYHWCAEIRRFSKVPILFLSSYADNMNIVMAINMGGDDFLAKPFDTDVLLAKVQALLRRTYDFAGATDCLSVGGAILRKSDATLLFEEEKIELTKNEYRILEVLMGEKGKVVSRETLMNRLWETDSFVDDNTLTVNMTRLRKKLEENGLSDFIRTKKGIGYLCE